MSGYMPAMVGAASGVSGTYAVAPFQGQFGPSLNFGSAPALQNGMSAGNLPVLAAGLATLSLAGATGTVASVASVYGQAGQGH